MTEPLRVEYLTAGLEVDDLAADPIAGVRAWLGEAVAAGVAEANTMHLATVDATGAPSVRAVLLKEIDHGLVFYTNRESRKGHDMGADPRVAASLVWELLHRQIRVEGRVEWVDDARSDAYFASRPEGARRGAAASPQSRVIPDRAWLEARVVAADPSVRPPHWGGYRIVPRLVEFWQGRPDRLHDRIRFDLVDGTWGTSRLAP